MDMENRLHWLELILDEDRYNELHTKVLLIFETLANQVLSVAVLKLYFN